MGNIKKCSKCLAEIPISTKKCQHCGSKQKGNIRIIRWIFIVFCVFVGIPLLANALRPYVGSTTPSQSTKDALIKQNNENRAKAALIKQNNEKRAKAEVAEFTNDRKVIIYKIQKLIDSGNPNGARSEAMRFVRAGVQDTELEKLISKAEAEATRIVNMNKTGIWRISYFVDVFGNPTKQGYIINKEPIIGVFSNSATENSRLSVKILISSLLNISIVLYEYASLMVAKHTFTRMT